MGFLLGADEGILKLVTIRSSHVVNQHVHLGWHQFRV